MRPHDAELCSKYGGLLALLGQTEAAEKLYRDGLAAHSDSAPLNYNLGVLLWQRGQQAEGRELILRAEALGMEIPAEVLAALAAAEADSSSAVSD